MSENNDKGEVRANNALNILDGLDVCKDLREAGRYFRLAVLEGSTIARYNLGLMYFYGVGVEVNHPESLRLMKKLAPSAYARTNSILGYLYWRGAGVARDYRMAIRYYKKAAACGDSDECKEILLLYIIWD